MTAWPGAKAEFEDVWHKDADEVAHFSVCDDCVPVYLDWLRRAAPELVAQHASWFAKFGHGISGVTQSQRALADATFVNPWAN